MMQLPALIVLPLLLITITLASFFKQKKWQYLIIVIMVVLIVMELISIYFSGGFIDYQFYVNLNINDIIEGLFIFKLQAVLTIVVFCFLIYFLAKLVHLTRQKCRALYRIAIAIFSVISICYSNGPVSRFYEIYQVTTSPYIELNQAFNLLNMREVPNKEQLKSQSGKNIIVISLESFEQGFLNFTDLTPNLKQLTKQYTFFPHMPMSSGSSWTTASMYTYMTGMPFLIGGFNAPPLLNAKQTRLVSLGDILNQAGYQTRYVIGSPTFAAIGHIINMFGFDIISEKSYPNEYPTAPFGLYDKDTFAIAKRQIIDLQNTNKPFALFISTISTHAPNGFYDSRMASVISPKQDDMSFVAASLDYNLGQFVTQLNNEGLLNNTVFYIFPDHLMMGSGTATITNLSKKARSLYLLTNASESELHKTVDQTIYQIDLPRLILNGAQIETNAKFLTDYLSDSNFDKKSFIEQNKRAIATLNRSAEILTNE